MEAAKEKPKLSESERRASILSHLRHANCEKLKSLAEKDISGLKEHVERVLQARRNAHIPARHLLNYVEKPTGKWKTSFEKVLRMVGEGFLVALVGPRGTGKTQLAIQVLDYVLEVSPWRGRDSGYPLNYASVPEFGSRYAKAADFFLDIRSTFRKQSETSETQMLERYTSVPFLILDEMHERGGSEWEDRMMTHLVDVRYTQMKDTILITNLKKEPFIESVGTSIADRLSETGGFIVCDWPSFRGK